MSATVATVESVWRYPVKSMRGERLDCAAVQWTGLAGDRQYAFCKTDGRSTFPWLTGRDLPELVLYTARYAGADPLNAQVQVTAPDGSVYDIWDPALAERLGQAAGEPVRVVRLGRGAYDSMPVSILSQATLSRVSQAHGSAVAAGRFRPNVLVSLSAAAAADGSGERGWLGRRLQFGGGAAVVAAKPIQRCAMIAIDPESAAKDPGIVRSVVQEFDNEIGIYAAVIGLGEIRPGQALTASAG